MLAHTMLLRASPHESLGVGSRAQDRASAGLAEGGHRDTSLSLGCHAGGSQLHLQASFSDVWLEFRSLLSQWVCVGPGRASLGVPSSPQTEGLSLEAGAL